MWNDKEEEPNVRPKLEGSPGLSPGLEEGGRGRSKTRKYLSTLELPVEKIGIFVICGIIIIIIMC
jgi:hypothetical protein